MRFRPAYLAAAVALVLGIAGLVRGAGGSDLPAGAQALGEVARPPGVSVGDIVVSGAYVRQPASPDVVAAYLTITNTGSVPDTLESISTGAAENAAVHDVPGVRPAGPAGQAGAPHQATGPLTIAPGASITLAPGKGHIMLEKPTGTLRPGDRVSLVLTFTVAGQVLVEAPVIAISAPAPAAASSAAGGVR
jgi:periplasmic copper chaperone A